MYAFRKFIENYVVLTESDWNAIQRCFEQKFIEKGEMLLEEGKVCRHLYFLESGLLRFYIEKDGQDITKFFTLAPYCFTSQKSFTAAKPATENIQALEYSALWQTDLEQAEKLLALSSWNAFTRKLLQEVQFYTESILQELQTLTAEERYRKLLEDSNQLLLRVPLKDLASYLSIAPQSLSRIRKKLARSSGT